MDQVRLKNMNEIKRKLLPFIRPFEAVINILRGKNRFGYSFINVLSSFPNFDPNSGFVYRRQVKFAVESINNIFQSLLFLSSQVSNPSSRPVEIGSTSLRSSHLKNRLKSEFDSQGSDKASFHDYHLVYGLILEALDGAPNGMLEIGLGSSDTTVASNMGKHGQPGASLRVFNNFVKGPIYGADIDPKALLFEDKISSFQLDQLNLEQLASLQEKRDIEVDLFIDDGLHSVTANLNSLALAWNLTSIYGVIVIEDIGHAAIDLWRFVGSYLAPLVEECYLIRDKSGSYIFVLSKKLKLNLST